MSIRTLTLAVSVITFLTTASPAILAAEPAQQGQTITQAFQQAIANAPGKSLTGVIVDYAPGVKSPPHRHGAAFVLAYVLSGAIRSQVNDGKETVFRAGESWSEKPGDHHVVSENASETEPAKMLAIFVADSNDHDLVIWDTPKGQ
ncbi:cupin domain-containing protein [Castellaniella sp. FW104-16D08]|uniref:cupin domain-containing protein n=1 Tax=unclassified Castellaniella TaxID=2617606 RepID=UPI0033145B1C